MNYHFLQSSIKILFQWQCLLKTDTVKLPIMIISLLEYYNPIFKILQEKSVQFHLFQEFSRNTYKYLKTELKMDI